MTTGRKIKTSCRCFGIAIMHNEIYLGGGDGKLYQMDMNGNQLKAFSVGNSPLYSLQVMSNDMILCCQADGDSKLYCVRRDGSIVYTYSSTYFDGPVGTTMDRKGNIYVTCYWSNSVHCLSPDGKLVSTILNKDDGLSWPYGIAFNKNCDKLYIANAKYDEKRVLIFKCE